MLARICWTVAAAAGCLLGAIGVLALPARALVGWVGVGLFVGAVCFLYLFQSESGPRPTNKAARRVAARFSAASAAATVAAYLVLAGLVAVLGNAGAVVILMLLATAGLWTWWWRHAGRDPGQPTTRIPRPTRPAVPSIMPGTASIQELCAAWCRSYWLLHDLPPGLGRCQVVNIRECLLDELERRDPAGFQRWLQTGARAGSDPRRYLTTGG